MQNKEKIMEFQILITRRHVGLLVALLLLLMNLLVFSGEASGMKYFPMATLCILLLMDLVFAYFSYFHSITFITIMRFLCLTGVGLMVGDSATGLVDSLNNIVIFLFYMLFIAEATMLFDTTGTSSCVRLGLLYQMPFVLRFIYYWIRKPDGYVMAMVNYFSLAALNFLVIFAITTIYGKMQKDSELMLFAKDRIIDKAKDNSDKVKESQHELKELNEQLGLKKFQLEEVNRHVREINNNFNIQNKFLNLLVNVANSPRRIASVAETFKKEFDFEYAGAIFRDDFLRKNYPSHIEEYIGKDFVDDFCEFFTSDAFIDSHSGTDIDFVCNEVNYDEFPYLEECQAGSMMARAIRFGENSDYNGVCVYVLISTKTMAFENNLAILDSIFAQLSIAFENLALYRQMEQLSIRDPLSTLYNRRYMNLYFEENFIRKKDDRHVVSLAMIDIDHFKNINDTYGDRFGDIAIETVAGIVKKYAHANGGKAFRYGGEEFVVILSDVDITTAGEIFENVRREIKSTAIVSENNSAHVNVSIGVTEYPSITKDISKLIDRADKAMYYSKQHGRDQLVIDNGLD